MTTSPTDRHALRRGLAATWFESMGRGSELAVSSIERIPSSAVLGAVV